MATGVIMKALLQQQRLRLTVAVLMMAQGNINRTLVIPSSDTTLRYCWDACYQCDGSDPGVVGLDESAFISLVYLP